mmetsp:Transcript_39340/g.29053  ORF Transcript_39340/g.29053 Transcript_39340/m.29053 type:complete len:211 (+) Transcript_39340:184-816(+)|eukprot:CAMPEP_0202963788 /NCGR_PEP_ID=MMETSP1396-20130829/7804_1 /ASSEMBLY_ACC=CAM_ASM_000872 /TAXON_ID= /ORGANISM="Pseudokeronopsis sp., Strain Brazil" /LENGTH=210 /DNA_ID=CAMNT_0049685297 /DNA_START=352 /DNA_END=984 /DNA_ORIENTATION=-
MDGSDNPKTRYLINDACVIAGLPLVSGSALQWEGSLTVYGYHEGPCYRCLFPEPAPPRTVQNCSDGGVIGPVPGMIGTLQATEIIKIILGVDEENIMSKRMLFYDGLAMKFRTVKIRNKMKDCKVCGENPSVKNVQDFDYDEFCQTKCDFYASIHLPPENNITVEEFHKEFIESKKGVLVDVRPKVEYGIVSFKDSIHIDLPTIKRNELD